MDKAVIYGINNYPGCELRGCVPDAKRNTKEIETNFNFDSKSIHILTDSNGSTKNILEALNWLVSGARPGDRLFFAGSGHGAQAPTIDSRFAINGMDDVICPQDFDWSEAHMIRAHKLHNIFAQLPDGVKFYWLEDACHSGDDYRAMAPSGKKYFKSKSYPMPFEIEHKLKIAKRDGLPHYTMDNTRSWFQQFHPPGGAVLPPGAHPAPTQAVSDTRLIPVGFLPGCKSNQTSADTEDENGNPCGALTNYFWNTYHKMPQKHFREIGVATQVALHADQYDQTPVPAGQTVLLDNMMYYK